MAWNIAVVDAEPDVVLTDWAVMQVQAPAPQQGLRGGATRHFVGMLAGRPARAQVSSPVLVFDPAAVRGVTESGRVYQLNGFSPVPAAVLAIWTRWKAAHQVLEDRNVSSEVIREIFAASGAFGKPA